MAKIRISARDFSELVRRTVADPNASLDFRGYKIVYSSELDRVDLSKLNHKRTTNKGQLNLSGLNLRRADFWKANVTDLVAENTDFHEADLRDATLVRATCRDSVLHSSKLQRLDAAFAIFSGCDLRNADFTEIDASSAKFGLARMSETDVNRYTDTKGRYSPSIRNVVTITPDIPMGDAVHVDDKRPEHSETDSGKQRISARDFSALVRRSVADPNASLDFRGYELVYSSKTDHVDLSDLFCFGRGNRPFVLSGLNLRGADFGNAATHRLVATGTDLSRSNFREAKLYGADFREAKLDDATFEESTASDARFIGADLRGTNFAQSFLLGANFDGALMTSEDFRKYNANTTNREKIEGLVRFAEAEPEVAAIQPTSVRGGRKRSGKAKKGRESGKAALGSKKRSDIPLEQRVAKLERTVAELTALVATLQPNRSGPEMPSPGDRSL